MQELILGVGQNKTVDQFVSLFEKQLLKVEGAPRKVYARAQDVSISAERDDFSGPFLRLYVGVDAESARAEKADELAQRYGDVFKLIEQEGTKVLSFAAPEKAGEKKPEPPETPPEDKGDALEAGGPQLPPGPHGELVRMLELPEVWRVHGEGYRYEHVSTELLFQAMVQYNASDVHLSPGQPPIFRVDNDLKASELMPPLSAPQIRSVIKEIAPKEDWREFEEKMQASFNFHQMGLGYSRVSCFIKEGAPHLTFRFLPENIPSFDDLNIPRATMEDLAKQHHGLVLVTGMTGSGKSTTTAALVDWINSNKNVHILTIESPVEYVHRNKKAVVSQRSTGKDVENFFEAVTGALRHDPDVILIGEMRDPDTIRAAISAAATGHLVISTLHANTASEVVNRIVSFFDPVERDLVKLQLRDCLRCVICQRLLPKEGGGRVPALEILINDIKPINDAIVSGNTDMIRIGMQQTVSHSFLFEQYLNNMIKQKVVGLERAREFATDVSILDQLRMGTYSVPRLDSLKGQPH